MLLKLRLLLFMSLWTLCGFSATYFVSNSLGNDMNAGTSIAAPWKTLNKVNISSFIAGDSILFKRGDSWRGQLIPQSGSAFDRIYYGDYDSGNLPQLLGSINMSDTSEWISMGGNVWKCNTTFSTDVGNIIFDNASSIGNKKWNQSDLQVQGDFWFDLSSNEVFIFSLSNPGAVYSEIELAIREDIINQTNCAFVTFENLSLKYGGAHGIGGSNTSNIHINACEISFVGGGDLDMDGTIRFGNGVEFWGNASNNTVSKCKIWEIYDTGVTNQNHTTIVTQSNIKYQNNVIWNCGLSTFEFWCKPSSSVVSSVHFENNTCAFAGSGWGAQRPDFHGVQILISGNTAQTDTIHIKNNIFFEAQRSIYAFQDSANGQYELDYNVVYQPNANDTLFALFPSNQIFTYVDSNAYTSALNKDENTVFGDPEFANLSGLNFSLLFTSIAIDAGVNTNIIDDFDSNPRPINGLYDIGAYEFTGPIGMTENELSNPINIYPNPTCSSFRIRFNKNSKCQLNIYDINGKRIDVIENYSNNQEIKTGNMSNGTYTFTLIDKSEIIESGKIVIRK